MLYGLISNLIVYTRSPTMCNSLYISVIAKNFAKSKGLGRSQEMQEIQVQLPAEAIFFAISLL